ncbi:DMT family transporter [Neorhizobium sp. T786]|uniref:DMT family transporter n=1 Tax=Pseudorhizobium xiangyangii TaxID=2883104 RepID=UPI001CFF5A17|nr:DMT family transporter [Neorhizobium xiangyangii]MCB5201218.1 DMT family transporter [Neorhizobium xiangyangii]
MKPRDLAVYLFLAIAWGLSFLVMLQVLFSFGLVGAVSFRSFIAVGMLVILATAMRRRLDFSAGWHHFVIVGLTTVVIQLIGLTFAMSRIGTAMSAILVSSIPLFSMLISRAWGMERISGSGFVGLALGVLGIVLLVGFPVEPVTADFVIGCVAALVACVGAAFGSNYANRHLRCTGAWEVTIGAFLSAGVITLPFLFAVPVPAMPSAVDFGYLLIAGCLMSALTYVCYFDLVASIGPTRAISVEFAVTLVAVFVGAIMLGEQLSPIQIAGGAVILAGCALVLGLFSFQRSKVAEIPLPHQDGLP